MKFILKLLLVSVFFFGFDSHPNPKSPIDSPFTLKERINVSSDILISSREFAVIDNFVYLHGMDKHTVHRMDLTTKKIDKMVGGQGNGPGEFSGMVATISTAYDRLFVSTVDLWVHAFDKDLKMITRKMEPSNYQNFSELSDGNMVVCAASFERAMSGGALNGMEVVNSDLNSITPTGKFAFTNTLDNMMLSRCFVASGPKYVLYAQLGEAAVYFYDHQGAQVKKVTFDNWSGEMKYLPDRPPNAATAMIESMGFKDHRTPMGGYIHSLHSTESYTIVQGGITTSNRLSSAAFIDHKSWTVKYAKLPQGCSTMRLQDDTLFCLYTRNEAVFLERYDVDVSKL